MSDAANAPDPTAKPSRAGRLLSLIRKLIDYGKEAVATARQLVTTDPRTARFKFGTADVAKILAAVARALHRAEALEARIVSSAARLDKGPRPASTPASPRKPRAPRPPAEAAQPADPLLARLPTPEQLAAEVRRRPIGAVIVDICLDLGIGMGHPLWAEIEQTIVQYGGSLVRFIRDHIKRSFQDFDPYQRFDFGDPPPGWSPFRQPAADPTGTGPP